MKDFFISFFLLLKKSVLPVGLKWVGLFGKWFYILSCTKQDLATVGG